MSIAPKPIIAATLLLGVSAVWIPRITGFDPFGWLPEELPRSTGVPSSGADPHGLGGGEAWTPERDAGGLAPASGADLPLRSLDEVVRFLERREEQRDNHRASKSPAFDAQPDFEQREPSDLPVDENGSLLDENGERWRPGPASPAERLELFLREHPLHTIIQGNGLTTATFGYLRVQAGDRLLDESFEVHAIDLDGVVLQTPAGCLRVHLPLPGARAHAPRPRGTEDDLSSED